MLITSASLAAQHPGWWATLSAWGEIGSLLAGLAAVILAGAAIIGGSAGLQDWREKQREQAELARQEAENIRLDRLRLLHGWRQTGVDVYGVELVKSEAAMNEARDELLSGLPTAYVILRVTGNENLAGSLRQLIEHYHNVARAPEKGEYEALERGRQALLDAPAPGDLSIKRSSMGRWSGRLLGRPR